MTAKFIVADVFDGLATLEDNSVDLVVTSPPFLALRSYLPADHPDKPKEIGSEATPAEFLDVMLRVVAELRRVLAPHGSLCVELGDTYAGSGGAGGDYDPGGWREGQEKFEGSALRHIDAKYERVQDDANHASSIRNLHGKKQWGGQGWPLAKSRTLIPQLFEVALAYGINPLTGQESPAGQWRIRNVVTWARPNPPVGALGDKWRPATSDVIVACTSGRRFWDDLATRRHGLTPNPRNVRHSGVKGDPNGGRDTLGPYAGNENLSGAPLLDYWVIPLLEGEPERYGPARKERDPASYTGNGYTKGHPEGVEGNESMPGNPAGAPLLDYWVIPPGGYEGSHYAVFPPELVVPLVKAMCPERVCLVCGEPSRRIVETAYEAHSPDTIERQNNEPTARGIRNRPGDMSSAYSQGMRLGRASRSDSTLGWSDCGHDSWRPGLVLDCFAGSGTTLAVASGHGHDSVGIDLDSRNAVLAEERIGPMLFERVEAV